MANSARMATVPSRVSTLVAEKLSRPLRPSGFPSAPVSVTSAALPAFIRASCASLNPNRTQIGSVCAIVVSSPSAPGPTRLPSDRSERPVTPAIGAATVVYDRFSSASRTRACAAARLACAVRAAEAASSYSRRLIACWSASGRSRSASRRVWSTRACSCARPARACASAISKGARSIR